MPYIHFTEKELYSIEFYLNQGLKPSHIALKLNRSASSISRLLKKYSLPNWTFDASYCILQKKQIKAYNNSKNKTKNIRSNYKKCVAGLIRM